MAGGRQRAAETLQSRIHLQDQLASVLSYPAFAVASTHLAMGVILLLVVPPLVAEGATRPRCPLAI